MGAAQTNTFQTRYTNGRALGRGASGMVWRYTDKQRNEEVAVKELCIGGVDYDEIKNEKLILEKLDSPFIVKLLDHYEDEKENVYRLIMEYCSDGSLEKKGLFSEKELLIVADHVLRGLAHMHESGYIHRDIKPANILCTKYGYTTVYKLADVGASKSMEHSVNSWISNQTFMAPEVMQRKGVELKSGTHYNEKIDIWSVGVTFLHLGEGRGCVIEENPKFKRIKNEKLQLMITKCLKREPSMRPSAHELRKIILHQQNT